MLYRHYWLCICLRTLLSKIASGQTCVESARSVRYIDSNVLWRPVRRVWTVQEHFLAFASASVVACALNGRGALTEDTIRCCARGNSLALESHIYLVVNLTHYGYD